MAEYPSEHIKKLDKAASSEGGPLIGLILLAMIVTVAALYVVGQLANAIV